MAGEKKGVAFDRPTANVLVDMVRERTRGTTARQPKHHRGQPPRFAPHQWEFGKAYETITALSYGTDQCGSGRVNIWTLGNEGLLEESVNPDGGEPYYVTAYNPTGAEIEEGWLVRLEQHVSGVWMIRLPGYSFTFGKADSTISARSGNNSGSGTVSIWTPSATGVLSDSGTNVTAYNWTGGAITDTAVFLRIGLHLNGSWFIIGQDCS